MEKIIKNLESDLYDLMQGFYNKDIEVKKFVHGFIRFWKGLRDYEELKLEESTTLDFIKYKKGLIDSLDQHWITISEFNKIWIELHGLTEDDIIMANLIDPIHTACSAFKDIVYPSSEEEIRKLVEKALSKKSLFKIGDTI